MFIVLLWQPQVYQPSYEKIKDFWIDFNYGSESITLFVEERDRGGNYKV